MATIYLDHAAYTPIEPAALDAMSAAGRELLGNPHSLHLAGRSTVAAIEEARASVAGYLDADPTELSFWGSTSEALEAALRASAVHSNGPLVSSRIEHPALERAVNLHRGSREMRWIEGPAGEIDPAGAAAMLSSAGTVALSGCNHELGTVPNLTLLRDLSPRSLWVIDAVQAAPWLDLSSWLDDRTLLAVASAKLGGPPGVAALRVPRALQRQLQASLGEPVSPPSWFATIGFGAAMKKRSSPGRRASALREASLLAQRLLTGLRKVRPDFVHNAGPSWLGPILNVSVPGASAVSLASSLDLVGVAVSRTAACRHRFDDESSVVRAAFPSEPWRASASLRWSVGWHTTEFDVDEALARSAPILGECNIKPTNETNLALLSPLAQVPADIERTE